MGIMNIKELLKLFLMHMKRENTIISLNRFLLWCIVLLHKIINKIRARRQYRYAIKDIFGSRMISGEGFGNYLVTESSHEPFLTKWLQENVEEGKVIYDIGANIGYYTLILSKLVGKAGRIFAIEPEPANLGMIEINMLMNHCKNITLLPFAAGDKEGICNMYRSFGRDTITLLPNTWHKNTGTFSAQMRTLDNIAKGFRSPDIIRMDIEGGELAALRGASALLANKHNLVLIIEMHFYLLMEKTIELLNILKKNGFEIASAFHEPYPDLAPYKHSTKFSNLLARNIGIENGENRLALSDLYAKKFTTGQIERLEVVFKRKRNV